MPCCGGKNCPRPDGLCKDWARYSSLKLVGDGNFNDILRRANGGPGGDALRREAAGPGKLDSSLTSRLRAAREADSSPSRGNVE